MRSTTATPALSRAPHALAAGAGGAALLASLWMSWYEADLSRSGERGEQLVERLGIDITLDAWQAFDVFDIVFAVAAACGIALLVATRVPALAARVRSVAAAASTFGTAAALLCLLRIVDPPGASADPRGGAFLGLASAAVVAVSATLLLRAAGRSSGDAQNE